MDTYLLMIYVTTEQEIAIRDLFQNQGWQFKKKLKEAGTNNVLVQDHQERYQPTNSAEVEHVEKKSRTVCSVMDGSEDDFLDDGDQPVTFINSDPIHMASSETPFMTRQTLAFELEQEIIDCSNKTNYKRKKKEESFTQNTRFKSSDKATKLKNDKHRQRKKRHKADKGSRAENFPVAEQLKSEHAVEQREHKDIPRGRSQKRTPGEQTIFRDASKTLPNMCGICNSLFVNSAELNAHMVVHPGARKCYKCVVCKRKFFNLTGLKRHWHSHVLDRRYVCEDCDRAFISGFELWNHQKVHSKHGRSPHTCDICSEAFYTEIGLKKHADLVHSDKAETFICHHCGKSFHRKVNLVCHVKVHSEERPYKCSYCEKDFKDRVCLVGHLKTHTRIKQYKCTVCDKAFLQSGTLRRHTRIHTGEKPYKCSICNKQFRQSGALKRHKVLHDGTKQFSCGVCRRAFHRRDHLQVHMKQHPSAPGDPSIQPENVDIRQTMSHALHNQSGV